MTSATTSVAPRTSRAFTLVETLAIVGALTAGASVVAALAQPVKPKPAQPGARQQRQASGGLLSGLAAARASARQLKCSTQIRGIDQSFIVWASNNQSMYPLPSQFDTGNDTVAEKGRAKDHTANIMSIMIFNGNISAELCVCPDEHNKRISPYNKYEYTNPNDAEKPANALWDPALSANFTDGVSDISYAHLQPSGDLPAKAGAPATGRMSMWSDTSNSIEAVIGDRSPEIESVSADKPADPATYKVKTKTSNSITLKIHGGQTSWEGNIGYNDGHVDFATTLAPQRMCRQYTTKDGSQRADTNFFDEPDDPAQSNTFLGIFVQAGKKPADFKPIWD